MPHIRIEYSANLRTRVDWRKLMHDLHPVLAKAAATVVENCKSRAIERDLFHVGTVEVCNAAASELDAPLGLRVL